MSKYPLLIIDGQQSESNRAHRCTNQLVRVVAELLSLIEERENLKRHVLKKIYQVRHFLKP